MNVVPILSKKGFFARYYGGRELYESLDDKPGSPVHPTFLATCLLFQVSMYCFKKIQQRKITSSLVNKTPNAGKIIFDSHCSRIWMTWKVITLTNSPQQFTLAWTISTVSQLWVLRRITQFIYTFYLINYSQHHHCTSMVSLPFSVQKNSRWLHLRPPFPLPLRRDVNLLESLALYDKLSA